MPSPRAPCRLLCVPWCRMAQDSFGLMLEAAGMWGDALQVRGASFN